MPDHKDLEAQHEMNGLLREMVDKMDAADIPAEGRRIITSAVASGLPKNTPAPPTPKQRVALWTVQYSGAKHGKQHSRNGTMNIVAFTLEEAVLKLRMSDDAYADCRITSVKKQQDIDLGLPDELLRKEI